MIFDDTHQISLKAAFCQMNKDIEIIKKMKIDPNFSGHYINGYLMAKNEAIEKIKNGE